MKVLIMVQSCTKFPYNDLLKAQLDTWDSVPHDSVDTMYYFCDKYNLMHVPFREALKEVVKKGGYNYIFRTNASSYIDKQLLFQKANRLPLSECYCGINGGGYASGCGVFISHDLFGFICDGLKDEPHGAEDVYIGQVLQEHGVGVTSGAERYDFNHRNDVIRPYYHYRCKSDNEDRTKDITAFNLIHKYLHG